MKTKGVIKSINSKSGFGEIKSHDDKYVNFELFECDYDFVRIGDLVVFDLVKLADGKFDALNINFSSNPILSELNHNFSKQQSLNYKVIKQTSKGYIIDYEGFSAFLPNNDLKANNLVIGDTLELFIIHFNNNGESIIVSSVKNRNTNSYKKYKNFIYKENSFEFEVHDINSSGLIVYENDNLGLIPNSHITPFEKKNIEIGQLLKVNLIGCSIRKGLLLSIRNHDLYNVLSELHTAYKDGIILKGEIIKSNAHMVIVVYKGINLHLNKNFILDDLIESIDINESIDFKVIDFTWNKEISISNKEIKNYELREITQNENMFKGNVLEVLETGVIISINKLYHGYMPFNEMSDNWRVNFNVLKKGSIIKASVNSFDFNGISLSRIKYLNKAKKKIASKVFSIGDKMVLKMRDRMAFYGVHVLNPNVKGLIPLGNIIPAELRDSLDRKKFKDYCKEIFKRRGWLKCVISDIDTEKNKIGFELDYDDAENQERIKVIADYFDDRQFVLEFHNNKSKLQVTFKH
jgi:ribosomal protein S1